MYNGSTNWGNERFCLQDAFHSGFHIFRRGHPLNESSVGLVHFCKEPCRCANASASCNVSRLDITCGKGVIEVCSVGLVNSTE